MRRLFASALVAGLALVAPSSASADAGGPCNGTVDTNCTYYDNYGRERTCHVWHSGGCLTDVRATIDSPFGGDCNGGIDVNCDDWSGRCTLWVRFNCVVG